MNGDFAGENDGVIGNCYNTGSVTATSTAIAHAGGIVGGNENIVSNCYNAGSVSSSEGAGGIVGGNDNIVCNCYNTGSVNSSSTSFAHAGGIAGENGGGGSTITNCYNIGSVSSLFNSGGIAGGDESLSNSITNCYYLNNISIGVAGSKDTTIKCTLAQMETQSTYIGFDFTNIWQMSPTYLPYLKAIPYAALTSISFENNVVLGTGGTYQTSISLTPYSPTFTQFTYSSLNSTIAKVDQNGVVTGVATGIANIMVQDTVSGKTAVCSVTVQQGVTKIVISGQNQINVGTQTQLTATLTPNQAANQVLSWSTSDPTIATVDQNGLVTSYKGGNVTIYATATDGTNIKASFTMQIQQNATSVSLNKSQLGLKTGGYETLIATVLPQDANNKAIIWSSSDSTIAAVDITGKVTAIARGTATITATTSDGGFISQCAVTVTQPVSGITLKKSQTSIGIGGSQILIVSITPTNANDQNITWTSSDPCVTVNQEGIVTGVSEGTSVVIAETEDGNKTATCVVTVDKTIPVVTFVITIGNYVTTPTNQDITVTATTDKGTLNATSHTFTENGSFEFEATDTNDNITTKTVTITNIDKTAPIISGVTDGGSYNKATISFNEGTATLNGVAFTSGSTVSDAGTYSLVVTDAAGNSTTIAFSITILKGDINDDGKVTSADALMVLKAAAGKIKLSDSQIQAADVNSSGTITSADALEILKYASGKITKFS